MKTTNKERRRLLIEAINQAFEGVELEDGVSLHETRVIDDRGSDAERKAARKYDTQTSWQDVHIFWIEENSTALSFFDAKGLRFYLPAYMVWTLEFYHTTSSNSAHSTIFTLYPRHKGQLQPHRMARYHIFNEAQAKTICSFLRYMHGEVDTYSKLQIQEALDDYWGKFCSDSDPL